MNELRKYFGFFTLELRQMVEFKSDFYLFWLESLLKGTIMIAFWWSLWGHGSASFNALDKNTFIALLLSTQILQLPFRGSETIAQMIELPVVSGRMALILCRPVHPLWMNLARVLCQQGRLMVIAVTLWFFAEAFILPWLGCTPSLDLQRLPLMLLSLGLGALINFFLYTAIGTCSYWVGDVWSLIYVLGIFAGFLSGQFFPLHINPQLEFWSCFLPFRYISYSAATVGCGVEGWEELARQGLCLVLLWSLTLRASTRGLKKFEASGG